MKFPTSQCLIKFAHTYTKFFATNNVITFVSKVFSRHLMSRYRDYFDMETKQRVSADPNHVIDLSPCLILDSNKCIALLDFYDTDGPICTFSVDCVKLKRKIV